MKMNKKSNELTDKYLKLSAKLSVIGILYKLKNKDKRTLLEAADAINELKYLLEKTECNTANDLIVKLKRKDSVIKYLRESNRELKRKLYSKSKQIDEKEI